MNEPIVLSKLKEPFSALDIEWRVQSSGVKGDKPWAMVLAYVTARAIQNRLDDVCGAENWKVDYREGPGGGVLCGISIKVNDEWITKWDGAENTQVEAVKGGISSALKRAGSVWGVGRYLYSLKSYWAVFAEGGEYNSKIENGKWFKWNPPKLPKWALPKEEADMVKDAPKQEQAPKDTPAPPKQAEGGAQPATGMASDKQRETINKMLGASGLAEKADRLDYVNEVLRVEGMQPVKDSKELTSKAASKVIGKLVDDKKLKDAMDKAI